MIREVSGSPWPSTAPATLNVLSVTALMAPERGLIADRSLGSELRGAVRTARRRFLRFSNGLRFRCPVHRARGREHQPERAAASLSFRVHGVQKVERAGDVDPEIPDRLFKRLADQGQRRQMTYRVGAFHGMLELPPGRVCRQSAARMGRLGRTREPDHRMPRHGELPDDCAADESGGAGNENAHVSSPLPVLPEQQVLVIPRQFHARSRGRCQRLCRQ